jgi:hypothetical protein
LQTGAKRFLFGRDMRTHCMRSALPAQAPRSDYTFMQSTSVGSST